MSCGLLSDRARKSCRGTAANASGPSTKQQRFRSTFHMSSAPYPPDDPQRAAPDQPVHITGSDLCRPQWCALLRLWRYADASVAWPVAGEVDSKVLQQQNSRISPRNRCNQITDMVPRLAQYSATATGGSTHTGLCCRPCPHLLSGTDSLTRLRWTDERPVLSRWLQLILRSQQQGGSQCSSVWSQPHGSCCLLRYNAQPPKGVPYDCMPVLHAEVLVCLVKQLTRPRPALLSAATGRSLATAPSAGSWRSRCGRCRQRCKAWPCRQTRPKEKAGAACRRRGQDQEAGVVVAAAAAAGHKGGSR